MALHLYQAGGIHLLAAYENGSVALWAQSGEDRQWQTLWISKLHVESGQ